LKLKKKYLAAKIELKEYRLARGLGKKILKAVNKGDKNE
jgi:hypothetical protein